MSKKTETKTDQNTRSSSGAGRHATAVSPPSYGVGVVDRQSAVGVKTGLPTRLKAGLEQASGFSMDQVRVHYNSPQPAQLKALAFTRGTDIHLGPGQERHLPHEGGHVVQQMRGKVTPTTQFAGYAINNDPALEHEATVLGARAERLGRASPGSESRSLQTRASHVASAKGCIQRFEKPGVGVELETRSLHLVLHEDQVHESVSKLKEDAWDPEKIKGQDIFPGGRSEGRGWAVTAELGDLRDLYIEIIVSGKDGKGVKLDDSNTGVLHLIGKEIYEMLEDWQVYLDQLDFARETPFMDIAFYGKRWKLTGEPKRASWGIQVTTPMPLEFFYEDFLPLNIPDEFETESTGHFFSALQSHRENWRKVEEDDIPKSTLMHIGGEASTELLALLSLIKSFVVGANKGGPAVKKILPFMPRTSLAGMYKLLDSRSREFFDQYPLAWKRTVDEVIKKDESFDPRKIYFEWDSGSRPKLTYDEWIIAIPKGIDQMQVIDKAERHGQIGHLKDKVEGYGPKSDKPAPIVEFRDIPSISTKEIPNWMGRLESHVREILLLKPLSRKRFEPRFVRPMSVDTTSEKFKRQYSQTSQSRLKGFETNTSVKDLISKMNSLGSMRKVPSTGSTGRFKPPTNTDI